MGIPHLITHLRPYAQAESLSGKRICIDGPALAYHVYFICLAARFSSENPFEAMPSYQEIRDTTIAWLYGLEASGATIEKIFFDGYLPATKLNTRLERLRSQTKKLDTYHHANPALCQLPRRRTPINPNLFGRNSVKSSHLSFPPVPFLVPTVLDALLSSGHFGTFTRVVPGEADSFCAAYLNEHGGAVITGDSDLLVYDLGAAGSVVFLRDIEVTENGNPSALQSPIFEVTNIAHRLGLPAVRGIRELAFELRTDSNASLGTLLRRAATGTAAKLYSDKYQRFCQEYEFPTGIFIQETPCGKVVKATQRVLQSLDPRISEYVLQFPSLSSLTELEVAHSDIPHIFLPFLLGSPVLTNAFETSTAVRLLAYSILNLIVPENERCLAVIEHRKQQTDSGGRKWEVPDASLMEESCEALLQLFSAIHSRYPAASHAEFFLAVAIHQDIEWSLSMSKSSLTQRVLKRLVQREGPGSQGGKSCTWETLQFVAQLQGSYYSFRILRQILELMFCHGSSKTSPPALRFLRAELNSLPSLDQSPSLDNIMKITQQVRDLQMVEVSLKTLGCGTDDRKANGGGCAPESLTEEKPRKRRKKNSPAGVANRSSNPFDLLELDES